MARMTSVPTVTRTGDELRLESPTGSITLTRIGATAILMTAVGHDKGQFGEAPLEWLELEIGRHGTIEMFVDTRELFNATQTVADRWSEWMRRHKGGLRSMSLLVSSKYVQLTIEVAKVFSRTGELMRIYTDESAFAEAITHALGRPFVLRQPRAGS